MSRPGVFALVPVKRFASGKSRLAAVLAPEEREALARALCRHALGVLAGAPGIAGTLVVTDGGEVADLAAREGAEALVAEGAPLGEAVALGLAALAGRGAVLVLMADLPLVAPVDIARLLAALDGHDVVLAPDRHEDGTSALGMGRADVLPTSFGRPGSFRRHFERAKERGLRLVLERSPGLGCDLDGPEDLAMLRAKADAPAWLVAR